MHKSTVVDSETGKSKDSRLDFLFPIFLYQVSFEFNIENKYLLHYLDCLCHFVDAKPYHNLFLLHLE